ncbi:MAG: hypothetical protein Q9183_001803 [Haloplaca sp. 2 TL-2023]
MSLRMGDAIMPTKLAPIHCPMMKYAHILLPLSCSSDSLADVSLLQQEMDRIDIKHHITKILTGGRLYLAPLGNPKRILDIGTGTGIWAIEMAEQFPNAQITGIDLSPVQPKWYEKFIILCEELVVLLFRQANEDISMEVGPTVLTFLASAEIGCLRMSNSKSTTVKPSTGLGPRITSITSTRGI